jgi:hypothetical protein
LEKADNRDDFSAQVWASVEKNAADVSGWPEWKRRGSGILQALSAAMPADVPVSPAEDPQKKEHP